MAFNVSLDLPIALEQKLRAETCNLDGDVKEAYALELFRRGKISHFELSQILGFDRFETDAYLKQHRVIEGSLTMEDLNEQGRTLERVLGPVPR
jgi:predicted HTH domain antitoxin